MELLLISSLMLLGNANTKIFHEGEKKTGKVTCKSGEVCQIICDGTNSCGKPADAKQENIMEIFCPKEKNCDVECNGDAACQRLVIHAKSSIHLTIRNKRRVYKRCWRF